MLKLIEQGLAPDYTKRRKCGSCGCVSVFIRRIFSMLHELSKVNFKSIYQHPCGYMRISPGWLTDVLLLQMLHTNV